ncbi:MAG: TetR/AcrR family transcriptional regulator [Lachnospiraceae bacterium]|nr:TetR/AcrR family transcriptional regulator [Lachnospiraceae bacterium]
MVARIDKSKLTKLEIIQVATKKFIEKGFSNTSIKVISDELNMSTGNITFYFPSKEHLLAELVDMLCEFQWKMMEDETSGGKSSIMALALELVAMASMCEEDEKAKNFYISAYTSALSLEIIRRNDAKRAKELFSEYCINWTEEQFVEAETLVSGIEYATLMTTGDSAPLNVRIAGAINTVLRIYNVPEEIIDKTLDKVLVMNYRRIGKRVLKEFKEYVENVTEQAFYDLLKNKD